MIKCNLAVLLAERGLKITKVSNDTGISRTTLTSLMNNYSSGIQFDTLNTLCNYLQTTPELFFPYVPFDYSVNADKIDEKTVIIDIIFHSRNKMEETSLLAKIDHTPNDGLLISVELPHKLKGDDPGAVFLRYYNQMPVMFQNEMLEKVSSEVDDILGLDCNTKYYFSL